MVDANSGAIYVIGGIDRGGITTFYNDVWVSTDGGARPDLVAGVLEAVLGGYSGILPGYSRGARGVLWGLKWYLGGT